MDKPSARIDGAILPPKLIGYRIKIFLKSGHTINVVCEDYEFTFNPSIGEYEYSFEGLRLPKRVVIDPNQIAGYIVE